MKTLELKKASKPLSTYAAELGVGDLLIMSKNKPIAALVSLKDTDSEGMLLGMNPAFLKIIRLARAEVRRGKVVSLTQVKQELLKEAAPASRCNARAQKRRAVDRRC